MTRAHIIPASRVAHLKLAAQAEGLEIDWPAGIAAIPGRAVSATQEAA